MDPEVIILDEPTASLDIYYTRKIRKLLNELHCDGRTLILSTHDIDFAYEWADEVVVMHHGEMLYHGAFYRLFEEQGHCERSKFRNIHNIRNCANDENARTHFKTR